MAAWNPVETFLADRNQGPESSPTIPPQPRSDRTLAFLILALHVTVFRFIEDAAEYEACVPDKPALSVSYPGVLLRR